LDASKQIGQINDDLGTTMDSSFSNSLGKQALGALGGFAGGNVGQRVGGLNGRSQGPIGQGVGMIAGSTVGQNVGRDLAMGAFEGVSPGDASTPGGEGNRGGDGAGADATMMAGTSPTQAGQSAAQTNTAPSDYGPVDFNGYASYAESFFA
jgi:hypothetical protein